MLCTSAILASVLLTFFIVSSIRRSRACDGGNFDRCGAATREEDSLCVCGNDAAFDGKKDRPRASLDLDFRVDVLDVIVDGLRRNAERSPDLLHRAAAGQKP